MTNTLFNANYYCYILNSSCNIKFSRIIVQRNSNNQRDLNYIMSR